MLIYYIYAKFIYMEILAEMPREQITKAASLTANRYLCKKQLLFTVNKIGKKIDDYYVTKALIVSRRAELPKSNA
jgi:hypothetical protein